MFGWKRLVADCLGLTTLLAASLAAVSVRADAGVFCPGDNTCAETTDGGDTGGRATWYEQDNKFTVCDLDSDGRRAAGRFRWWRQGQWNYVYLEALGNGNCKTNDYSPYHLAEDQPIEVMACLRDADGANVLIECSSWEEGYG